MLATWQTLCRTPLNCRFNVPLRVFVQVVLAMRLESKQCAIQTAKRVLMGDHSSMLTYPVMKVLNNNLYIGDHVLKVSFKCVRINTFLCAGVNRQQ